MIVAIMSGGGFIGCALVERCLLQGVVSKVNYLKDILCL